MSTPSLDLYPPPVTTPTFPPTWEDVERLALDYPVVHAAVTMVRCGNATREQALIVLVYALAEMFQRTFSAELERRYADTTKRIFESAAALAPHPEKAE